MFRANPRTGKSYLVLTDVAYYLIFTSFILFTVTFVAPVEWETSTGEQLKHEVARVGGILLIMGILHALNVVALPVIGRLLSLNKRLDDDATVRRSRTVTTRAGVRDPTPRPGYMDRPDRADTRRMTRSAKLRRARGLTNRRAGRGGQ